MISEPGGRQQKIDSITIVRIQTGKLIIQFTKELHIIERLN